MDDFGPGSLATIIIDTSRENSIERYLDDLYRLFVPPDYHTYIKSQAWKDIASAARIRAEYRCQICYETGKLSVHHRTYVRLGRERSMDLTVLCSRCHKLFHGILPEPPDVSPKEIPF